MEKVLREKENENGKNRLIGSKIIVTEYCKKKKKCPKRKLGER